MGSLKRLMLAGAAAVAVTPGAFAADIPVPPPIVQPVQAPVQEFSAWYLRGDIGVSNQHVREIFNDQVNNGVAGITLIHQDASFDGAPFFGVGAGFQFNSFLRAEVTGEFRSSANFHALDLVTVAGVGSQPDVFSARKSEVVVLANGFIDLGTWWCVTPFVGAGVGFARNTIGSFVDLATNVAGNPASGSTGFAPDATKFNFAWALHAGLAYRVTPGFTVELAYRFLNLGDAVTGNLVSFDGTQNLGPMHFKDLTSHDLKLGVRWQLSEPAEQPVFAPPLMRKG